MPIAHRRPPHAAIATLLMSLALAAGALPQPVLAAGADAATLAVAANPANPAFAAWADRFAADSVRINPQMATATQYFSGAEQDALDRHLTPLTPAQRAKEAAQRAAGLARLTEWTAGGSVALLNEGRNFPC